jgi:Alr-MurF fusion protein
VLSLSQIGSITHSIHIELNVKDSEISELVFDSRKVITPSLSLFFAIKTKNDDGHKYIQSLIHKGVKNFIITESLTQFSGLKANFFQVVDAVLALQQIASFHRAQFNFPVIGITGSNGKTTVKEWISQALSDDYSIVKTPNSYNSQIGVPLSVWKMNHLHSLGIFEAGISENYEMDKLADVIIPKIGIFCNIGDAHAAHFTGIHQKLVEKLKLFKYSESLIYCTDHTLVHYVLKGEEYSHLKKLSWGISTEAHFQIEYVYRQSKKTIIKINNFETLLEIPFSDHASIENVMHIAILLIQLGFNMEQINDRLSTLSHLSMRMEIKEAINRSILINDTYSLDINSLKIALDFLGTQTQFEKKTLILSEFDQVDLKTDDYKYISSLIKEHQIKKLILVGANIGKTNSLFDIPQKFIFNTTDELIASLPSLNFHYEAILIKGARRFQFEKIAKELQLKSHQTVLQVDLGALTHNLNYYRGLLNPNTKLMAMVKALSYGLGDSELINELRYHNIDYLAVAYTDEGIALRKRKILTPIVVLGAEAAGFSNMIKYDLEPEIFNFHYLKKLEETLLLFPEKKEFPIHIKIDTGMHRLGFNIDEIDQLIEHLKKNPKLRIASVFSHFAASEDPKEDQFTREQSTLLTQTCEKIEKEIGYSFMKHIANSSAISRFPEFHFDLVRLGLGLYGFSYVEADQNNLQNTVTLKSIITQIKNVKKNDTIGYNRTFVAENDMKIAIVPIGYADGYPKELSNGVGKMIIQGEKCPVVGKICMDMTMIDITGLDVHEDDEVIVYNDENNLKVISNAIHKSPYELLTAISKRVQRIYIRD